MPVRRDHEELVVITKTYDLILWSCHHTGKFPRNHRFVLGERIERNQYDLLEVLIRAKYTRTRQELLAQANLVLECDSVDPLVLAVTATEQASSASTDRVH